MKQYTRTNQLLSLAALLGLLCPMGLHAQYNGGVGKGDARGSYINYTYSGSWSPENPNGFTTGEKTVNTMYVESGTTTLASATNAKRVEISPDAALDAANLTLTDSILIMADATGYGMYKGSQQNVRIQQYVANAGWHNMALPVSGNLNQFGSVNTAVHPNTRNVYSWEESTGNWVDVVGASDGSQVASSAGAGYMVYVGTNGVSAAASALDAKGNMLTTATPTLSNAGTTNDASRDGWNLIGNPFSCGLDFTQLTLTDVNNSFSIWDPASEVYRDYSGLVADIASGVIAPMQSFWVKATGASPSVGTLDMDGDGTVSTSATFYKQQTVVADRFAIEVVDLSNTSVHDEIVIGMVAGTHDGLDQYWDAPSRLNATNVPTLMVVHQGEEMSINAIDYGPNQLQPKQLQLRLVSQKHGQAYEIRLHDSLLTHAYHIELEDTKLQRKQKLTDGHYRFTLDTAATAAYRFVLHLSPITTVATPLAPVYDDWSLSQDGNTLQISEVEQLEGATEGWIYDMNARLVAHFSWETNNANKQVDLSSLPTGLYLLRLSTIRGEEVQKLLVP